MKAAFDLHIHSALSACAQKDMTPNNIVNMSWLKGLDIIAVTDHNSAENCEAVISCARRKGIAAVPGIELETREEVHLVCLFPGIEEALNMQKIIYASLPPLQNRDEIFGEQLVIDGQDCIAGRVDRLLLTAANISLEKAFELVRGFGGMAIPAHVDRSSYSIISNLGIIPGNLGISCLEISRVTSAESFVRANPGLENYRLIQSSDAHSLGSILERESFIELRELSAEALIAALG